MDVHFPPLGFALTRAARPWHWNRVTAEKEKKKSGYEEEEVWR
jgi:hypothetical protein